jgi:antitoxin ParD1/3/4
MATMNISLPDDLKEFADQQVTEGSYTSTSEYIRKLLRDQKEISEFRAKLLEGSKGPWTPADDAFFEQLRADILDGSINETDHA